MRLDLTYDSDNLGIGQAIELAQNRLYVARTLIPREYEGYFRESAHYISAHTSTAIEGNTLEERAAMVALVEGPDPSDPMQLEKVNLDEAYELMGQLASDRTTRIDEGIVRAVNSMVLRGLPASQARSRGRYRTGPSLVVDAATREVRYRPPPPEWIPELMAGLATDIGTWRGQYSGAIAAALAHFGLISIHPFEDGNGRTARLISDTILNLTDWSAEGMISVSQAIHEELGGYYRALREAQGEDFKQKVDVTGFVKFHTDAICAAAARLEEKAVRFNRLRNGFARKVQGVLNERQVTGLMFMVDIGRISSSRFARLTESSQATALADLNSLVERGLVVKEGAGKSTRYRLRRGVIDETAR